MTSSKRQSAFRPLSPPRNLTAALIDRLAGEITAGRLPPNARLPTEQEMMASFKVSRTVVREAIAVLRAEGLVETRQGSGAYVAADLRRQPFRIDPDRLQSIAQVLDVMELRMTVEVEAAGLAAERRSRAAIERLEACHAAFVAAIERGESAVDEDYAFHCAVGEATGNAYFGSFLGFLGRLIIPRRTVLVEDGGAEGLKRYLKGVCAEHEAILRAIVAGDVRAARRAMSRHLTRGRERCRRMIAEGRG